MTSNERVLAVLAAARDRVAQNWGQRMRGWSDAQPCASTAILTQVADEGYSLEIAEAVHAVLLRAAGLRVPDGEYAARKAVYRFNDAQRTVESVLAAFDKAIAIVDSLCPGQAAAPSGPDDLGVAPRRPHPGLGSRCRSRGATDRGGGRDAILGHRRGSR